MAVAQHSQQIGLESYTINKVILFLTAQTSNSCFYILLKHTLNLNLGAEYPSPKRLKIFNHGRIVRAPKRLKFTYSATKLNPSDAISPKPETTV